MSTTVTAARRILQDVSRVPPEEVDAAQRVIYEFHARRPRSFCVACGSGIWSEHSTPNGGSIWGCQGCHRPASLTREEWNRQQAPSLARAAKAASAVRKLVASEWEQLIATALEARATYLSSIAALAWAIRNGATPHSDTRAAQLVAEAATPPDRWHEAASLSASGGLLAPRLAALESEQ